MKLSGAEAARYFARPDPARAGLLIFGADPVRVADRRAQAAAALAGPDGAAEMRITRIAAADLRREPARLADALRERGFFPGPRVVVVEDATDALAPAIAEALRDWAPGDAQAIVTAGALTGRSALKTLFETHPGAVAIGLYDDPPGREELDAMLAAAGLPRVDREAMAEIAALSRDLDPGDLRQVLEKLSLWKHGDPAPVTLADVAACAPATLEAGADDLMAAVADGRAPAIGPLIRRLEAQGASAVTLAIAALRHVRTLHALALDPNSPRGRMLPHRAREAAARQARDWGPRRLEEALAMILDTDLALRSASRAPSMALLERCLIRLAMMRR